MSLSTHQQNVADFFGQNATQFVDFMVSQTPTKVTVIDDIFQQAVTYLDHAIRGEIKMYKFQSLGYNRTVDMLIESHIVTRDSELGERLIYLAREAFRMNCL